jgi:hypothetical protein
MIASMPLTIQSSIRLNNGVQLPRLGLGVYQSVWAPYVESTYNIFWNNWVCPRRSAEVYSRTVSNFAESMLTATRIANNAMITNMEAARIAIQHRKNDMKEMTRIGVNTARTFEQTSKEATEESSNK